MSAARSLTEEELDQLAELVADRLRRRRAPRPAAAPAIEVSDTDRAAARAIARRLGLRVRGERKR